MSIFFSIFNLLRLQLLIIVLIPFALVNKNNAIYLFLKLAGPSFLKLGQILSVRPDVVGDKMAKSLAKFQDSVSPFCEKKVKKILKEGFGDSFAEKFFEFDLKPVASASIAQVHKAKLKDGRLVAVKILRPSIAKTMARDISTLRLLSSLLRFPASFLSKACDDVADLLDSVVKSELDLLQEAANASRLKEDLKDVKGFYVPQIYWNLSSEKILVLEWIDGIAFSNEEKIRNLDLDKKQIAKNLVISYFNQVYVHGFFHADMHPGNLFLMQNGDIAVVDFGIVGKIDKKTRLAIAEILIGFLGKDYQEVAKLHIDAGLVPKDTNIDDLALSCRKIGEMIVGSDVKDISVARLLSNLIVMTREYKMEARPELLLLQKTLLLVEGVGVMLDRDLNMWDLARPWVKEWAKKNIGFDAKVRDAVLDLFEMAKKFLRNSQS